jgi:zinc/manganese transport system permease protein
VFDLPSGAMIVWTLAGCALLAQAIPRVRQSHPAHAVRELPVVES